MLTKRLVRYYFRLNNQYFFRCYTKRRPRSDLLKDDIEKRRFKLVSFGNGTYGTPRSLYTTINERYCILFNCGEGTVKAIREQGLRLQIHSVFITHKSWVNLSGMIDLFLTLQRRNIHIYGPPGIEIGLDLRDDHIFGNKLKIVKHSYDEDFCNSHNTFIGIPLTKHQNKTNSSRTFTENDDVAVAYLCKKNAEPGRFNTEKCLEYGPEIMPYLTDLKAGHIVELPDGRMIDPKNIMTPSMPNVTYIVLECPNEDYLDSLLEAPAFAQFNTINTDEFVDVVVHLTSSLVMSHPKYKEWIQRFSPNTTHVVMNDSFKGYYERKVHKLQRRLHKFDQHVFPLLHEIETDATEKTHSSNKMLLRPAQELRVTQKNGKNMFEIGNCIPYQNTELNRDISVEEEQILSEWKKQCKLLETHRNISLTNYFTAPFPEVVFLGTSSRSSSPCRNVTSILVHISESQCMLLDCGEGTYSQLINLYGLEKTNAILQKLSVLFISHHHDDHQMGLTQLLYERKKLLNTHNSQHLYIVASLRIRNLVYQLGNVFEPIVDKCSFIPFSQVKYRQKHYHDKFLQKLPGLQCLQVVPVKHCAEAHGVVLDFYNGFKLVYSGDTAPCTNLIEAGQNCHLLIHEATFPDDLVGRQLASSSNHCTVSDAISVGHQMNARIILLTHFTQRESLFESLAKVVDERVAFAFDFMRITPRNMGILPFLTPLIYKTYFGSKEMSDDEDETSEFII